MIANWWWLLAPLTASLLMVAALVPLGYRVLARGVVFADLAIAQWAALGSLVAPVVMPGYGVAGVSVISLGFAMVAVALMHLVLRLAPDYREAMIGSLYVLGASLATLVVSDDPHGAQRLAQTLNGDLLWVRPEMLAPLAIIALLALCWQFVLPWRSQSRLFLPLFALAVTVSVDQAGIYVVFATLIAAPLTLCHMAGHRIQLAMTVCFGGHATGLALSALFDLPAGPAIVTAIIAASVLVPVLARALHWLPSVGNRSADS